MWWTAEGSGTGSTKVHTRRGRHRLSLGSIAVGDAVDDGLCLLMSNRLVVLDDVAQVVAAGVVRFADAHGVVSEVDIAVVAWRGGVSPLRVWRVLRWT